MKVHFILPVTNGSVFSLLQTIEDIHFGLVRMYVTHYRIVNIDNPYFEDMVNQIYPPELKLNKTKTSDTEAPFLDLHLSISNGFVSSKIYAKRDVAMFLVAPLMECIFLNL